MQNRYAFDIGDYGKFGLLRHFTRQTEHNIGLVWYMYPDESHNNDGLHIKYLEKKKYRVMDPELYDGLASLLGGKRSVEALERRDFLNGRGVYFSRMLDMHVKFPPDVEHYASKRKTARMEWLEQAAEAVGDQGVVFLDPDNGIEIKSCFKLTGRCSGKFAYYEELARFMKRASVLIVYHHLGRHGTHAEQISARMAEIREKINPDGEIFALRFRAFSPRAYFVLTRKNATDQTRSTIESFLASAWGTLWDQPVLEQVPEA